MLPVVILAGGKAKPELQAAIGGPHRALAVVGGKTLLAHMVEAMQEAGATSICVVGDMPTSLSYHVLPDQGDFVANLFAGLSFFSEEPFVLVSTCDLPFLTGNVVLRFMEDSLQLAKREHAGFIWPVVPVSLCYERFPQIRRTSLRLSEGVFTGGNLALIAPKALLKQQARIASAYAARKSPLRLAKLLGASALLRLLLSQTLFPSLLTISWLESRVSNLLGSPARALRSEYPELATDLDRPEDFRALKVR
ncbi:nucleotidyltransferase family protein [Chthonomonas calidirosea]|uniref:nucleotidyltransferase family protein n=1 Tax=Chthonomonas calidirosea TaxID=454171 RepID=UPI0006ECAC54|nr:nucleotidyltransferase family protein [Chthonomonas calidirosea]CEK17887.1 molybdopterin-guanine dinucleotide biosynthesis protein A [Chthonomonas calidirosea]